MRLHDQVAVVTGASRGLGRAIALGLAREGAHVAVCYRSGQAEADEVVGEIRALGRRAIAVQVDTGARPSIEAMVATVVAEFGRIEILVNNAGVMNTTSFLDLTEAEWDKVIDTNLKGYFLTAQAVARQMVKHHYGRIVNCSSTRQEQANLGNTAYCCSKGGIYMLNRVMAVELAPHGICVNSIAPGTFETDLNRHYLSDQEFRQRRIAQIPAGRLGELEEVVGAVVFLASREASFCVGASIMIDGGQTLI
jgi:NAD(P)-dependent dehydrogenase (short-subunit alcohol dehydrogenase family)